MDSLIQELVSYAKEMEKETRPKNSTPTPQETQITPKRLSSFLF